MTSQTLVQFRDGLLMPMLTRHRQLIWELAKRDHRDRYAGSMLGSVWAVGHPLAIMVFYVVVFTFVFRVRIGGTPDLPLDYTAYLIAGYLPWMAFQESMVKSAGSIAGNASLVKQVVFPVEVLPVKCTIAAMLTQLVGTGFLVAYLLLFHRTAAWTYILLPLLLGAQFLAMTGLGFTLGAVGAYFRDLKEIVQVSSMVAPYLMPIFYLPDWVPAALRPLIYVNPFSYMVWCYQDVFYFRRIEHPLAWVVFIAGSLATLQVGARIFHKVKIYFGNVL